MLLIVCSACDTRHNSEHRAESIIYAVNRVRHPTAAAPMPSFTFEDRVEHRTGTGWRCHCAQRSCVRLFLQSAFPQKFLDILFARERAIRLIVKLRFLAFL